MKPPVSILNPAFRYTNAAKTDLRKTFARIRYEQEQEARRLAQSAKQAEVVPLRKATP
jgi:hypothetical protein